jgi:hypothetical protein
VDAQFDVLYRCLGRWSQHHHAITTKSEIGKITGQFPAGWQDNSNWAPVYYTSEHATEGTDAFWRINIPDPLKSRIQLNHHLPQIGGKDLVYELSLMARGTQTVELGVRQIGPPYKFLWSTSKSIGTEWQTHRWLFKIRRTNPGECGLWLNITGSPATIDIKHIQLRELTSQQIEDQRKAQFPGQGPVNLLRQSRLPLGLQTGWSLDRQLDDADDVQITSVQDSQSPTGSDVLQIVSTDKRMLLRGEPIIINRTWFKHTASVYVKGDGEFEFTVNNQRQVLGHKTITLKAGDPWQRIAVTFKPVVSDDPTFLAFAGQGTFKLDGMMVRSGEQLTDYQSAKPVEVALAAGAGKISSFTNIHFQDEKPVFRFAITGLPAETDAKLITNFTNLYGKTVTRTKPIKAMTGHAYYAFDDQPYGAVRIKAIVTDAKDQPISTENELVMHRLHTPKYWMKDAPNSAFGVHTLATRRHVQMAKALGINWTRLHDAGTEYIGWYHIEPTPGQWEYRDTELKRYRQFGMKIFGALSTAPKWASMYPGYDVNGYFDRYYMPRNYQQYANHYAKHVVTRYADMIDAWDVWNEPWGTWWCVGHDKTKPGRAGYIQPENEPKTFVEFEEAVYPVAKSANPNAIITGFNTHVSAQGVQWTRGMVEGQTAKHCDVFSYHQYTHSSTGYPDDVIKRGLEDQRSAFPDGKIPMPIWMTEGSPTSGQIASGLYDVTIGGKNGEDVVETADRLTRFCLSLLTSDVQRFFLYSMHCHNYFGLVNGHQVLMTPEGALHPASDALSAMTWQLEDKTYRDHKELVQGVHAWTFADAQGNEVTVLSTAPTKRARYELPASKDVKYFDFLGNPLKPGAVLGKTLVYVVK